MKQRILSSFMALVLCLSLLPTAAFAQSEDEGHAPSADIAVCTCETVCTDTAMNTACPICGAEDAQVTDCGLYTAAVVPKANPGETVSYIEFSWNEKTKTLTSETKAASGCTTVTSETTEWNTGWYVASGEVTIDSRVTVTGDVKLILADGANLIVNGSITVNTGNTFTVYAQSQPIFKKDGTLDETNTRTGKLTAQNVAEHDAGIGGNGGKLVIHGGVITATGGEYAAGIGRSNYYGTDCEISIYGGVITATGNFSGAGIDGDNINIHGGVITASGGHYGAGIGGKNAVVTIHGGTVTATGGDSGAGIGGDDRSAGGTISIYGGMITATGGDFGAGIGGGRDGAGGTISIYGGTITATGGFLGAGIGGGYKGAGGEISIHGGTVAATGDEHGAGIGGGMKGAGGKITIRGGTITATGVKYAAGIGGGHDGAGGTISFHGGTITATGGGNACGIGSGYDSTGGEVSIYGGQIKATGGEPYSESASNSDTIPTYAFSLVPVLKDNALCRLFAGDSLTSLTQVSKPTDTTYTGSKAVHVDADHDSILNTDDETTHICKKCSTVTAHTYIPNPDDETTHLCKGCGVKAKHSAPVLRADFTKHTISGVCGDCLKAFGTFTLTAPTGPLTYDGNAKAAAVTGTITGIATPEISYALLGENGEETAISSAPVSAGTYKASIACGSGADAVSVSVTYTIDKAAPTIQLSIEDWVAGSTPSTPSVTGNDEHGREHFQYKGKNEDDSTYTEDVPTEVGTYTIRVTVSETENYTQASDTADFSILAVAASVTIDGTVTQYASFADALTYANAAEDTPTLTLLADCAQESAQTVSRSMILDLNGKELSGTSALTIANGAELTLKGTTDSKLTAPVTVNGKLTVADAVMLGEVSVNSGNVVVNANATFGKLSFNGGTATLNSGTFATLSVGAGEQLKNKNFLGTDRGYYDTAANKWLTDAELDKDIIANVSVKETPIKELEVELSVKTGVTFGDESTLTLTYFGEKSPSYQWYTVSDDTVTIISGETSRILTVTPDAGWHAYCCAITVDGYTLIVYTFSSLTKPKELTADMIVLDDSQDVYDGTEKSVKFTIKDGTRTLELDRDYTVKSGDTATDVGNTLSIEGMGNYTGTVTKKWSLQKRTPEAADFTINGLAETEYNGTAKVVTAALNSPMAGVGDMTVKYDGSTTAPTCAGSYTVTLDVAEGTNFEAAEGISLGTLTINAATQTITPADNSRKTIIKNGADVDIAIWASSNAGDLAELTYTLVGTPAGITLDGTTLKAADVDTTAASFTIKVSAGAVDVNNDGTPEYSAAAEQTISVTVVERQNAGVTIDTVGDKTYGDSFTVTASVGTGVTGGTWSWTTSDDSILAITGGADSATVTVEAKKADTTGAKLTVTYTSDTHYGTATTAAIPVAKKTISITGVSATARDYDGTKTVALSGGELVGKVTGDDLSFTLGSGTAESANAGTQNVTTSITLTGEDVDNYTLTQPTGITVTIRKADPDYTVPTGLTATYGQTLADVSLSSHNGWSWMDDTRSVGDASDTARNFKAAFTPSDTTNYNVMSNIDVPVTVGKADPTAPTGLAGLKGNALSTVTLPDGWTWDNGTTIMDETKEYPASYAGSANYNAKSSVGVTVTVSDKQPQVLTVTMDGWTYGDEANDPQYTMPEGAAKLTIQYKAKGTADSTYASNVPTDVGEYTVRVSYETLTEIWSGNADYTIAKAAPTAADFTFTEPTNLTYDSEAKTATVTSSITGMGSVTVKYFKDGTEVTKATDAGSYTVKIDVSESDNYSAISNLTADDWAFTISKATPTAANFTANSLTATYNGTAKTVTATLDSPMTGAGALTVKYDGSTTAPTCAGSYTVTLDVAEGTNFEAAEGISLGTLTINAATQTITPADNGRKTIIKNGTDVDISTWASSNAGDLAELTYTLVDTPAGITLDGTTLKAADADTTAASFTIKVSAGAVDVNNDGTPEYSAAAEQTISVTVVERQNAGVTISNAPASKTYGDSFTVTASVGTGVTGGTWSWTTSDDSILAITGGADSATVTVEAKKADTTGAKLTVTYTSDTHYGSVTTAAIPVAKKTISITGVSATARDYDGTKTVALSGGELVGKVTGDDLSFTLGSGTMSDANAGVNKSVITSITLTGTAKDNYTLTQPDDITVTIRKADPDYTVPTGLTATYGQTLADVDLTGHTGWSWMDDTRSVGDASDTARNFKAVFTPTDTTNYNVMSDIDVPVTVGKADPTAPTGLAGLKGNALSTVTLPDGWTWDNGTTIMDETKEYLASYAGSANYNAKSSVGVTVTVSDKQPQVLTVTMDGWTYGDEANDPQYTMPEGASKLTIQYKVKGTADSTYTATVPANAGEYTVYVSYETATEIWIGSADFAIAKATPTGEPKYAAITTSGKTLADAALTTEGSTFSVAGSVKWVGEDGSELAADTKVEANKEYRWLFTPTGTDNYNTISGSIKLWSRSSGGGGSYAPSYTITVEKSAHGTISVSPKSAGSGDTVTITVTPDSGYDLEDLTVLDSSGKELSLTARGGGKYTFKMPSGKVTVKAVFAAERMENPFVDVPSGAYYEDAVLWALKHGITGGIDKNHFGPDLGCTRAQLVTFLWRAAGCPVVSYTMDFTDVGDSYYTEAVRWAASLGIVGGYGNGLFGTDDTITREQMATILYRFALETGINTTQGGMAVREFVDYDLVSGYATEAMQWAVSAGILQGYNNHLMPSQPCTRAQIVTMLYRLLGE